MDLVAQRATGKLAVTYDQSATHVVGLQLQRIYSLYALSRAFSIKYFHSPIERVEYQGFVPFLTGDTDPHFEAPYNAFFSLPSDNFELASCEQIRVDYLTQQRVGHYLDYAADATRPVLSRPVQRRQCRNSRPLLAAPARTSLSAWDQG